MNKFFLLDFLVLLHNFSRFPILSAIPILQRLQFSSLLLWDQPAKTRGWGRAPFFFLCVANFSLLGCSASLSMLPFTLFFSFLLFFLISFSSILRLLTTHHRESDVRAEVWAAHILERRLERWPLRSGSLLFKLIQTQTVYLSRESSWEMCGNQSFTSSREDKI